MTADELAMLTLDENRKVILIGSKTGSSGEAIALIFKKLPNISLFGEDSYGLTTGNSVYNMSDGAKLALTTTIFADRTKEKYGNKIKPDIYRSDPKELQ